MYHVKTQPIKNITITVPGSKSYTHRYLIAAALADGQSTLKNCLHSEDTGLTLAALQQMGTSIKKQGQLVVVDGTGGGLRAPAEPIYLGNSGTSMRLLTALAAISDGKHLLTGTERMCERPIGDLIEALTQIGIDAQAKNGDGCPPVEIKGGQLAGGKVYLNCKTSSQFLSALLLIAPYTNKGLDIHVTEGPVSKPYIDMTIQVMGKLGVEVNREGYQKYFVRGGQKYQAGEYLVEPDCSQASYFWAAAAITGASIKINGIHQNSIQGDVRLVEVFRAMGCDVYSQADGIMVTGGPLHAVQVDMSDMPDMVPTLAVVAAYAKGTTVIENVAHLKAKESDRIAAVANELEKMGIDVKRAGDGMSIKGGIPKGAEIDTYDDHRIAMSFAVAGLKTPGVVIKNQDCVKKSFPNFWQVFETLYKIA